MGLDNLASSVFKCNYRKGNHECNFTQISFPLISNEMVTQQVFFSFLGAFGMQSHIFTGNCSCAVWAKKQSCWCLSNFRHSLVVPGIKSIKCLNDCICKQWEVLVQWTPAQYFGFSWLQSCTELTKSCLCNRATSCFPWAIPHTFWVDFIFASTHHVCSNLPWWHV